MNFNKTTTLLWIIALFSLISCEDTKEEDVITSSKEQSVKIEGLDVRVTPGGNFGNKLINAIWRTPVGGIVTIPAGSYRITKPLILPNRRVIIRGAGRGRTWIDLFTPGKGGFIFIGANGTVIENLSINARNKVGASNAIIDINGKANVIIRNVHMRNADRGISTLNVPNGGKPMHGLRVLKCDFFNCLRGIEFNRKFSANPIKSMKKWIISNCTFRGKQLAGITIDCGNDGAEGAGAGPGRCGPGGLRSGRFGRRAAEASRTVTNFNNSEIRYNTFEISSRYNVAIAKSSNIRIHGNNMKGNTGKHAVTGKPWPFPENINIEHESNNIVVENNKISNSNRNGQQMSYVSVIGYSAYCTPQLFANGCRNIFIRRNTFQGNAALGVAGEYANRIRINNNTFKSPLPSGGKVINYWRGNNVKGIWHWANKYGNNQPVRANRIQIK